MKILVADNCKPGRYALVKMLDSMGYYDIIEAENGKNAYSIIKSGKIDLVFSDWTIPEISGLKLLKLIKTGNEIRDIPFVMVTTEKNQSGIIEAMKAGLQFYLIKPVEKKTLCVKMLYMANIYGFNTPVIPVNTNPVENILKEL